MRQNLHPTKGKIIVRIGLLLIIEVLLVAGSFGITTYIQSQSTNIGNTINIAGKNRFLTSNFLLELEKVNDGTAQLENLRNASSAIAENIRLLKSGGEISSSSGNILLVPLSSKYLIKWNEINEKQMSIERYLNSSFAISPSEIPNLKETIERTASELIMSSENLTRQLGIDARANSQNLVLLQTSLIIGIVIVSGIILYIMKRLLQPISLIIGATTEIKSGNFSIPPIKHSVGNDEVSLLA